MVMLVEEELRELSIKTMENRNELVLFGSGEHLTKPWKCRNHLIGHVPSFITSFR